MDTKTGGFLVRTARRAVTDFVVKGENARPAGYPPALDENRGVFTTLHTYPDMSLRGCIGYPRPVMPLIDALLESAVSAARDPRFPPLSAEELDRVVVEVSVLTRPAVIRVSRPEEYPSKVAVGKDGLIIESGFSGGLLLPQVPVEWGWDAKEFLRNLCLKAGLPPDHWLSGSAKISRFRAEIFSEETPGGKVSKKDASGSGRQ